MINIEARETKLVTDMIENEAYYTEKLSKKEARLEKKAIRKEERMARKFMKEENKLLEQKAKADEKAKANKKNLQTLTQKKGDFLFGEVAF